MKRFPLFILGIVLALSFSACQGKIRGQIFVDDNSNGFLDFNEKGAGSVQITVTKDGKRCASGRTLSTGKFVINACGEGDYCVHLNEDVVVSTSSTSKQITASGSSASGSGSTTGMTSPTSSETDSSQTGSSTTGTSTTTEEKKSLPPNCKAFIVGKDVNFEIAMKAGYEDELRQLPDLSRVDLKPGQEHTVHVRYPCSCTLLPFYLPDQLELVSEEDAEGEESSRITYQSDMNRISFSTARDAKEKKKPGEKEDRSKLCVELLRLRVKQEVASQNATHTLRFRAKCSDGEHALQMIPLHVSAESNFELTHVMYGTPALGSSLNLDIIVSNPNGVKTENLTLTISIPDKVRSFGMTTPMTECNDSANPIRCTFKFEAGEQEKIFGINAL